ncbi:MAG: tetratricopeptide repeat protein [Anaerolineales bacterium]|nr:tetratricopeptide repeat protein [Anaerolineales bacterium]
MPVIDTEFAQDVAANLHYWQTYLGERTTDDKHDFSLERLNLIYAVEFGLSLPQTAAITWDLLLTLYVLVEQAGYWTEWIPLYERATQQTGHIPTELHGRLLLRLGALYRLTRQLTPAIQTHQSAAQVAQILDDQYLLASVWANLSEDYRYKRAYHEAEQYARQSLAVFRRYEAGYEAACVHNTLGLLFWGQRDWSTAEFHLRQALEMGGRMLHVGMLARWLNNLAIILQNLEKFDEAQFYYEQARNYLEGAADTRAHLDVLLSYGSFYAKQKHWHKAQSIFQEVEITLRQKRLHLPAYSALVAYNLGNVLLYQNKLDEAARKLQESIVLYRELPEQIMLARALGTLGELFLAKGRHEDAQPLYNEAITLLLVESHNPEAQQLRQALEKQRSLE